MNKQEKHDLLDLIHNSVNCECNYNYRCDLAKEIDRLFREIHDL